MTSPRSMMVPFPARIAASVSCRGVGTGRHKVSSPNRTPVPLRRTTAIPAGTAPLERATIVSVAKLIDRIATDPNQSALCIHRIEEIGVRFCLLQLVDKKFHGIRGSHRRQ